MNRGSRRLIVEPLEDRTLMSTCHVTRLSDSGVGKGFRGDLRYCVNKVNAEPGPDVIDFTVTGTINLQGPLPELESDINIEGPAPDLMSVRRDTGGDYRIFKINAGANVNITGLTITNGQFSHFIGQFGGGIYNAGNLTLLRTTVTGNTAVDYSHYPSGGGIYNHTGGNLTIIDSIISHNRAIGEEGAYGGGICNAGTASIYNSAIFENVAEDFGIYDSGVGGGISNLCFPPHMIGSLFILNSTIHSNEVNGYGGGIDGYGLVVVSHSTIAFNTGEGISCSAYFNTECFIRNTIVAGNSGDIRGSLQSSGFNLIGNSNTGNGFAPTDILDVDPLLGPLQDNGGLTPTAALLPGSPAIDAGDNTDAPEWDQRGPGFPRIVNGTIDIGAFEVQSTPLPSPQRSAHLLALVLATADLDAIT